MQIRTGVSGVPSFRLWCLPMSSLNTRVLSSDWEKLLSESSFSSGLFSREQVRVNATIPPSLRCTVCSGVPYGQWVASAPLSVLLHLFAIRKRNKLCVSAYLFSLEFILEREINDSISSWSIYIKTWGVKPDIVRVCVCPRMVQHCHPSSLSKSTIIWSPPGEKCTPLISLE